MQPDDDPPDELRDEDPDRAAILARRRRFIAIALSSLASGAGCARTPPRPEVCLSVVPVHGPPSVPIPEDHLQRYTPSPEPTPPASPEPAPDTPPKPSRAG